MIVLVDQDGVLADFDKGHILKCRAAGLPEHVVAEGRDYWQVLDKLSQEEIRAVLDIWYSPGFFRELNLIAGAKEALEALLSQGHQVWICTTPMKKHRTCAHEKEDWVHEHLGKEFGSRLIFTQDKTLIHGAVLIDDKPIITGSHTPSWEHIIYDSQYNRHITEKRRLSWGTWREIL